jgi:hypothetical protein
MRWSSGSFEWAAAETDVPLSEEAFGLVAVEDGAAVLSPGSLTLLEGDVVTEITLPQDTSPSGVCAVNGRVAVLYEDGSLEISNESNTAMETAVEAVGKTVAGCLCSTGDTLAWMNTDGTLSRFSVSESLLEEKTLPENTVNICFADGNLYSGDGEAVYRLNNLDEWDEFCSGLISGADLLYTNTGVSTLGSGEHLAAGLPGQPETVCMLDDGTVWTVYESAVAVWAEIGAVETRLPEADVEMIRYRVAGQTGGGSSSGTGLGSSDASFGGVFRIYESVSSRPDPFSEFPLSSRDLRRSLRDLTIEELHLVGITLDPSGGDQAMVEDANGVAYVLKEGTVLRNNTHIAEITGNEVIVVQEVTVGSEDVPGGTTSIPTIFSMRLHEEGGL